MRPAARNCMRCLRVQQSSRRNLFSYIRLVVCEKIVGRELIYDRTMSLYSCTDE